MRRALVETPVSERIARYRLAARPGSLARAALTHWDAGLSAVPRPSRRIAVQPTKPVVVAETGTTVIDLSRPPTRASAGIVSGSASRIWMNADHRPVELTVALPDRRRYQARAELAVMLSSARGEDPDRLAVRLPAADLDTIARLLAQYADAWGFPAHAVAAWRARAERRAASDRDYSTHVFRPDDGGFVRIEFQVSDHVREGELSSLVCFRGDVPGDEAAGLSRWRSDLDIAQSRERIGAKGGSLRGEEHQDESSTATQMRNHGGTRAP